jgi:hypothetical protein
MVRTWIIAVGLCIFCFILPLQCFIIGNDLGLGIQGAVFRWQMTIHGDSLIPITQELKFIDMGIYTGKTAHSVILWTLGTVVLALTTMVSLMHWNRLPRSRLRFLIMGLTAAGMLYLASLCVQYGLLFSGPAGISLPIGVVILLMFAIFLYVYQNLFFCSEND